MRIRNAIRHAIAKSVRGSSLLTGIKRRFDSRKTLVEFQSTQQYWEHRYESGGDSGEGSYGQLARYKADFINTFCEHSKPSSVIEFGCGDGNQASLLSISAYTGIDISKKCIDDCKKQLARRGYQFMVLEDYLKDKEPSSNDLVLSLDVIFHLIEDDVYRNYIDTMLAASAKYAIVYSSNFTHFDKSLPHVRHREFVQDIVTWHPEWNLVQKFDNPFAKQHDSREYGSFAQFHLMQRAPASGLVSTKL